MSAMRKSLFALVLLGMAVARATPAAAQEPRGIWVRINSMSPWTFTVANLTDYKLALVTNSVTTTAGNQDPLFYGVATCNVDSAWKWAAGTALSQGTELVDTNGNLEVATTAGTTGEAQPSWNTTVGGTTADGSVVWTDNGTAVASLCFPLAPAQNVTYKSNVTNSNYPTPSWKGTLTVLPEGMDPKWTVTLNFEEHGKGTLVYMTANFSANPDWLDNTGNNISCSYPADYDSTYNVMTLSGTDLVATLYAPYIDDRITSIPVPATASITLVIRQRWPHTQIANHYDDSITMPCLRYQDNTGTW